VSIAETELEMVERHVREGARQVARQAEIVADLRARGYPSEIAEALLARFQEVQRLHQAHLCRISL